MERMSVNLNLLRIPMYALQHMGDIDAFQGLTQQQLDRLPAAYSADEVAGIVQALRFARDNPAHDFLALMPELPFSNAQIHRYLCAVLQSIEPSVP
jgi:hypothetical protein